MKKTALVAALALATLGLAGCGKKAEEATDAATQAAADASAAADTASDAGASDAATEAVELVDRRTRRRRSAATCTLMQHRDARARRASRLHRTIPDRIQSPGRGKVGCPHA